jgi:orotidine 5'-phosphate decarboxylase subfamily 1
LDFPDRRSAENMARLLDPAQCAVKVGFELFVAAGPALVENLQASGFRVFLDLKFHDIPNTVAGACRAAARLGVWMLNVHASGGLEMMRAAREAVREVRPETRLIAVTVLTSSDAETLRGIGIDRSPEEQVLRLADLAVGQAGLDGLVCSPLEASALRQRLGAGPMAGDAGHPSRWRRGRRPETRDHGGAGLSGRCESHRGGPSDHPGQGPGGRGGGDPCRDSRVAIAAPESDRRFRMARRNGSCRSPAVALEQRRCEGSRAAQRGAARGLVQPHSGDPGNRTHGANGISQRMSTDPFAPRPLRG